MREKQREETRRKLYLAALEVYRRDGMQNCRVEDIAQKAEVSRAAFYFHFPTREHVVLELIGEKDTPLLNWLSEAPPEMPLPQVLDRFVEVVAENWKDEAALVPAMGAVALCYTGKLVDNREDQEMRAKMAERFERAAQRGEISASLPAGALADMFLANVLSALLAWAPKPEQDLEFMLKGSLHLFFNGAKGV